MRKGTVLTFRRDAGGQLSASANALPLVTVRSEPLASAVFDIYFGEQPVSKRAKRVPHPNALLTLWPDPRFFAVQVLRVYSAACRCDVSM